MQPIPSRVIAVDWSGAASPAEQRRRIVVADWQGGKVRIQAGRTRAEAVAWLIEQAQRTPEMAVGLDFAFSYPEWFVREQGAAAIEEFWKIVAAQGESWLAACAPPFWGRPGRPCPPGHRAPDWRGFRRADRLAESLRQPKSPFQIGGAGAVGTGSLRGIPHLLQLRAAGFAIWPFHPPRLPVVFEIYPRLFTGPVNKSSRAARRAWLGHIDCREQSFEAAIDSEDAFDALCSALGMARQRNQIARLEQASDETSRLEGAIFAGASLLGDQSS